MSAVDRSNREPADGGRRIQPKQALRRAPFVIALLTLGHAAGARAQTRALSLDDVLDVPVFESRQPIGRSPDGRYVAAALNRPGRSAALAEPDTRYFVRSGIPASEALGDDIWLIDLRTGEQTNLTGGRGSSWGPAWSRDGRFLAFYSDRDGVARLWTWDHSARELTRVSEAIVRPFWSFEAPRWFNDGRRLLVKLLPEGTTLEEARALLPEPPSASAPEPARGAPDRASVRVFASRDDLLDARPERPSAPVAERNGVHFLNRSLGDLAIVDVGTGQVRRLVRRVRAQGYALSPDGRYLLYTRVRWREVAGSGTVVYSLVVVDIARGREHTLATDALRDYGITVAWSPVGNRIAYADTAGVVVTGPREEGAPPEQWAQLHRFSREGARFRSDYTPPLWSEDGRRLYITSRDTIYEAELASGTLRPVGASPAIRLLGLVADFDANRIWTGRGDESVFAVVRDPVTQRMGFHRFALDGTGAELLWSGDVRMSSARFGVAPAADGTVAFVAQDATHPEEMWLTTPDIRHARRVSRLHDDLARFSLGTSRVVSWRSQNGDTLRGALLLPPNYEPGRRYPLIVHVYGGRMPSAYVNQFGLLGGGPYNQHLLATRGYAVLHPDVPMSGGRPVDDLASAVLPAVDRLIELGIADSTRVGVTGFSSGGYATLALLTRSSRFAAAIAEQGFANLMSDHAHMRSDGSSPGIARVEGYGEGMGGPPWGELLPAYIEQSPFFHLHRIDTPLLLVHGEADRIVPAAFSGEVFVGLRRLGKPVALALYEGEGHGIGAWRRANLEDYWMRVLDWWDRWLGGNQQRRE